MHRILIALWVLLTEFGVASKLLAAVTTASGPTRPNLILILADDLGYGELGCFGQTIQRTPHLDRLAAEGLKFTRCYAGSPVCAPSRSVLMTGLHTGHTRVRGNAPRTDRRPQCLQAGDRTFARQLQLAGYATALVGKWGLGQEHGEGQPAQHGFNHFLGYLDQLHAHNPYPEFLVGDSGRVRLRNRDDPAAPAAAREDGAGWAKEARDFAPDVLAADALRWVEAQRQHPFFLFWSLITPHANNEGTAVGRGQEVPDLGPYRTELWPIADRAHAATVTRLDTDVGRLMQLLKHLHIEDRTLVLFTSDNGPHREGGFNPDRFDANGPLRGLKRDLYEGGIRVPLIAHWPQRIAPGRVSDAIVSFVDFFPTFAELAGSSVPMGLDGRSFANLLQGAPPPAPPSVLYWEFHESGFSQAVLMEGRWKAIRNRRRDASIELYDVATDTGETADLAAQRPEWVALAQKLFETQRTDTPAWPVREAARR